MYYILSVMIVLIIGTAAAYHFLQASRVKREIEELYSILRERSEEIGTKLCQLLTVNELQFERSQLEPTIHLIIVSKNDSPVARVLINVNRNYVPLQISFPNGQNYMRGVSFKNLPQVALDVILGFLNSQNHNKEAAANQEVMLPDIIPEWIQKLSTGPNNNGFVIEGVMVQSLVASKGRRYVRKAGKISVELDNYYADVKKEKKGFIF
ncbi:MAG: hypothetical protein AAB784_00625 [Patescibacteria group bacterium]